MKHIFILNSFGKRDPYIIRNEIFKYCVNHDLDYEIIYNKKDLSTKDIVNKYKNKDNIIYAVGGDGMINKVLNEVVDSKAYLSYIPYGTGNDLDRVLQAKEDGFIKSNVGKINDKYFINVACFGADADISNDDRFIHNTYILRSQRYNASALYHFITFKPKELEVTFNNKTIKDEFSTIAVCNSKYYGAGYMIAPNALIDDDLFDVYLVNKLNRVLLAKTILDMKKGRHESDFGVNKYLLDNLIIKSKEPIKANIDGEILESDEFNISLLSDIKIYNNQDLIKKVLKNEVNPI